MVKQIINSKNIINNTIMLYILTFAKLVLPLLTFPFLTRILSVESYGQMAYVKSCINYIQLIVDFGFLLSATREITRLSNRKREISQVCSRVTYARLLLWLLCFLLYLILVLFIDILNQNLLFSILSILPVLFNIFLCDFYFRGIEKMKVVTVRFIVAKTVSVILTLYYVKNDSCLVLIPVFDILTSIGAALSTIIYLRRDGIRFYFNERINCINEIRKSSVFFASDIASTAFTLINTFIIGVFLSPADVAYWGVAYTLISAVQSMYNPISNGIYPMMMKTKSLKVIKRIMVIFTPIIILGVVFSYFTAPYIIRLVNGTQYLESIEVFRCLLFVLLFGFPAIILGWPTLGAINRESEVSKSTILASLIHMALLLFLLVVGQLNIVMIAITRSFTELCLFLARLYFTIKHKNEFCINKKEG